MPNEVKLMIKPKFKKIKNTKLNVKFLPILPNKLYHKFVLCGIIG